MGAHRTVPSTLGAALVTLAQFLIDKFVFKRYCNTKEWISLKANKKLMQSKSAKETGISLPVGDIHNRKAHTLILL